VPGAASTTPRAGRSVSCAPALSPLPCETRLVPRSAGAAIEHRSGRATNADRCERSAPNGPGDPSATVATPTTTVSAESAGESPRYGVERTVSIPISATAAALIRASSASPAAATGLGAVGRLRAATGAEHARRRRCTSARSAGAYVRQPADEKVVSVQAATPNNTQASAVDVDSSIIFISPAFARAAAWQSSSAS
jgi:hypothetical protein